MAYDIIDDIRGHADKPHALLRALGYRRRNRVYRHPNPRRQAVFVRDFIDSGPQQTGHPALQAGQAARVDYSAAWGGPLVTYRWNRAQQLDARNFLMVGIVPRRRVAAP